MGRSRRGRVAGSGGASSVVGEAVEHLKKKEIVVVVVVVTQSQVKARTVRAVPSTGAILKVVDTNSTLSPHRLSTRRQRPA